MSYEVLARKWRPRRFEELAGQEHVVRALVNALDNDRLHHAFLFSGTRGVGKTTIARILAKSLNCEKGVSSKPCGECTACVELDEGRFIDLIEVDAASRTKVDDTRELLDNVQYAPTRGRYKVYLIDEVHMLSGHSFNALLKTLEEPPPHVKFLLATTEPQKLPMTVLSRCLQFNLLRLPPDLINAQLKKILQAEDNAYDDTSMELLARSADGSMRDALSLLDQAIAYGGGKVSEADVREMLGTIDRDTVGQLLQALVDSNAAALIDAVTKVAERSLDFGTLLEELLLGLHRIALAQADPVLVQELYKDERELILKMANAMTPEDAQLYYQIGLIGRRDLPLAPDPRTGLEMVLLRMLAFRPMENSQARPMSVTTPVSAVAQQSSAKATDSTKPKARSSPASTDWSTIVQELRLSGVARELANNAVMESFQDDTVVLMLDESLAQLHSRAREKALRSALEDYHGRPVTLQLRIGKPPAETPAAETQRHLDERQQAAVTAIENDPNVSEIEKQFNARINPGSIRPKT